MATSKKDTVLSRIMFYTEKTDTCWNWTGGKNSSGYGCLNTKNGSELAHRLSYDEFNGDIPSGSFICHKCDNPGCVNPEHLFLGTSKDNYDDMVSKGRNTNKGSNQHNSKLKEGDVLEIRRLLAEGKKLNYIAAIYGVTFQAISRIKTRKIWRWLK